VKPRLMGERGEVWRDLVRLLSDGPVPFQWAAASADVQPETRAWLQSIQERGLDWQFTRFATYLYEGTLHPLLSTRAAQAPSQATSTWPNQSDAGTRLR
jgi:hypothetical protein